MGRMADYLPDTNQLLIANQNGVSGSAGIKMNKTAFEPRIGLAYKLFGSDKTAIRAGYAVYHDSAWSMGAQGLWQNPPFFAESDGFGAAGCAFATSYCATVLGQTPNAGSMSAGFPIFTGPPTLSTFSGTLFTQPTDFHLGMVQQFNVNVERQLPWNVIATAGYAGSRGRHILVAGNDINTAGPASCVAGGTTTIGCNPDGSQYILPYAAENATLLSPWRHRSDAIRFAASETRDQDTKARTLRAGELHVLEDLRQRSDRRVGFVDERSLLPTAELGKFPIKSRRRSDSE